MTPCLIAIAGPSGAGKTELARALARRLREPSAIIAVDAYYHAQDQRTPAERAALNYDHPDALDWPLLVRHLAALVGGESVAAPVYLFDRHTRSSETRAIHPQPYLIVEGILALHHAAVRDLARLKAYVATTEEECLRRRLERDMLERGRTRESVLEQYERTVRPMARHYVLPCRDHADIVVSGERPLEEAVAALLDRLAQ